MRTHVLLLLLLPSAIASPLNLLLHRQSDDTCSSSELTSCPSSLPSNFCCNASSQCIALAGGTTAICCPKDDPVDCARILPITCSLDVDPDDLSAPFKTTVTDVEMETCASGCCPFGYTCSDDGLCAKLKDQSKKPGQGDDTTTAGPTSTEAPESTRTEESTTETSPLTIIPTTVETAPATTETEPTSLTTTAPTSTPTTAPSESTSSSSSSSGPDTTSIIGGVVGGCFVLLLIAVIIFLYIRRNNRRNAPKPSTTTASTPPRTAPSRAGNHAPITTISEPIMNQNSYRTDFILGAAPPPRISITNPFETSVSSPSSRASSIASCDSSDAPRTGQVATARLKPIRGMKAQSKQPRLSGASWLGQGLSASPRSAKGENIDIFADPDVTADKRYTHATTFSDLMDKADLGDVRAKGRFVPGTTPRI